MNAEQEPELREGSKAKEARARQSSSSTRVSSTAQGAHIKEGEEYKGQSLP
jgi:hypothetical protein